MKSAALAVAALLTFNAAAVQAAPLLAATESRPVVQLTGQPLSATDQTDASQTDATGKKIRSYVGPILGEKRADAVATFALETPANENGGNRLLRLLILLFILSMLP